MTRGEWDLYETEYVGEDGERYCTEYGHDATPLDGRYGCRYCLNGGLE